MYLAILLFHLMNQELAAYFEKTKASCFPPGTNIVLPMEAIETEVVLPGFVNCPAAVGIFADGLGLLHSHFERRVCGEEKIVIWPDETTVPEKIVLFGSNLERLYYLEESILDRFAADIPIEIHKFESQSGIGELKVIQDGQYLTISFYDPFFPEISKEEANIWFGDKL